MAESMFTYSPVRPIVGKALDYRSIRQDLISSNIANADTPFYRPKDIRFEEHLAHEVRQALGKKDPMALELAHTDAHHMDPSGMYEDRASIFFRDGHMARNDGNSVDLDVETTEMSKNGIMYNALVSGLRKHGAIFKGVLEANSRLS